jgi:hypothetical protein
MVLAFSLLFFQFARFSSQSMAGSSAWTAPPAAVAAMAAYVNQGEAKIAYAENTPKFFLKTSALPSDYALSEGAPILRDNMMLIGAKEAEMMREEKLFAKPGDTLKDFFGIGEMTIAGVLKPTGTVLDNMHFVNEATFKNLKTAGPLQVVDDLGSPKLFVAISNPESIPPVFKEGFPDLAPVTVDGKEYKAVAIGAAEAKVMQKNKLFVSEGDKIAGFFGNDIVVKKILPETETLLDQLHFIPAGMTIIAPAASPSPSPSPSPTATPTPVPTPLNSSVAAATPLAPLPSVPAVVPVPSPGG